MPPDGNSYPFQDPIIDAVNGSPEGLLPVDSVTSTNPDIARLANLSLEQYEQERASVAKRLGFRISALDKMVEEERGKPLKSDLVHCPVALCDYGSSNPGTRRSTELSFLLRSSEK